MERLSSEGGGVVGDGAVADGSARRRQRGGRGGGEKEEEVGEALAADGTVSGAADLFHGWIRCGRAGETD